MQKLETGQLNRLSVEDFQAAPKYPVVVVADHIRSLHNIGALFRTADAFLLESIYLCGITATPPNKEIHKTALGAELSVKWHYKPDTKEAVNELIRAGYTPVCIEQVEGAVPLNDFLIDRAKSYALILGNEVKGVQQEIVDLCETAIEIPQQGTKHSLNVSVAAGIVLWHFFNAFRE